MSMVCSLDPLDDNLSRRTVPAIYTSEAPRFIHSMEDLTDSSTKCASLQESSITARVQSPASAGKPYSNSTGTTINLSWQNGGGAAPLMNTNIYRGTDSINISLIDSTVSTSKANTVTGNGTYYYRILPLTQPDLKEQ